MKVTVYHASPVEINLFEVTEQGIHFGSRESAVEAVSRKVNPGEKFFLHKVSLDISKYIESFDMGYNWKEMFENEHPDITGYVYTNKYEPSTKKSYVTWCTDTIKILEITQEVW